MGVLETFPLPHVFLSDDSVLSAQQPKWAPSVPGSARAACIPSLYAFVTILPSAKLCHRVDAGSWSLHPIGPQFPLCAAEGWTTVSSRMLRSVVEPGGGFLRCARVLPAQSRPRLAREGGAVPRSYRGTCVRPVTLGLPPLVSVCGYFEREGSGRQYSPLLTTSCPLEGR